MTGGVVTCATRGTGRVSGHADRRSVRVEERAIAGAELGQGGSVGVGKGEFLTLDRRGIGLEDGFFLDLADCSLHRGGVKVCEGGLVGGRVHSGRGGQWAHPRACGTRTGGKWTCCADPESKSSTRKDPAAESLSLSTICFL